ncbi:tRNA (N6-threonylcarbamoyladenosine(37)-N6)-methyltransferase TrmO [Pseudovibrio sp. Alg231-02]|uniref:tRNA (N6-threonylcarbamoyladenosine(37)-N6)-methyltransferase TrmO n=1 Tax=Pseudovibrio sp. Alg231-02 TaxID=1922223 RepID=UPI000D55D3BC|nr:tRNA (N6-threonylcarbamoyladenosine(37)-N6)-methyltransferase TrmO [Pseudovibrio sp. Alg231-02]
MNNQQETTVSSGIIMNPIGFVRSGFSETRECPKSSRRNPAQSQLEIASPYADALLNITMASHLWVMYWLHHSDGTALVRRARGEEATRGVFASRSPNRPNPIGLSSVELIKRDGNVLTVSGLDCIDGTPILDIKPYVPIEDHQPTAQIAWQP